MSQRSLIGIDETKGAELALRLNSLLAEYQMFYMLLRGFHWNIRGQKFFELHLKFEELYNNVQLKVDEVAERILTLGETPLHSYSSYIQAATLKEHSGVVSAEQSVNHILDAFGVLLKKQRQILNLSAEAGDEGTNALMSDYIREQEKLVWMFTAYSTN